jgi:hypothetical protein
VAATAAPAWAGSVFITGHDPFWHAGFGGNAVGARNLAHTAISYARNGSALPFLFVESISAPVPGGNYHEAAFLTSALGYSASEYVVMDATALSALGNFRAALNSYSAIVVASDHGGMLTAAELNFLNGHSADIIDYLNAGGGLAAAAESNAAGLTTGATRFGYLPFLVSSTSFNVGEVGNTVTAFGASLGLTNSDVNGNFSHNYFSSTGGMTAVDLYNGNPNMPLSLATRSIVTPTGVGVPDGGTTRLLLTIVLAVGGALRRGLSLRRR